MTISATLILATHYLLVSILCVYGAHRIYHSWVARRLMKNLDDKPNFIQPALDVTPRVTIQIPLYLSLIHI